MKRMIGLLTLALSLALGPATVAQAADHEPQQQPRTAVAAKYGTGYFTVGAANIPATGGCFYHPYRVDVNLGYETDGWFLSVNINGPKGYVDSWVSDVYWDDWGASYWEEDVFICSTLHGPGTYTMTGTLHTVNSGSSTVVEQALTPASFVVNPYVAPAPPPPPVPTIPAPVPTTPAAVNYVDVKGTVSKQAVTRGVKLTFKAKPIPVGAQIRNMLKWTIIKDDKVSSFTQKPDTKKVKTLTFKKGSGVHKIKVLRNGKVATKVTVRA
nr:hypothetical protein [uncultured Nocardioides sp.]